MLSEESDNINDETNESLQKPYKIVVSHRYPMRRETRSRERIIFDECNYKLCTSSSHVFHEFCNHEYTKKSRNFTCLLFYEVEFLDWDQIMEKDADLTVCAALKKKAVKTSWKNRRFVLTEFVKTWDELVIDQLAEASKSWEESEPSFIDLNLLLDCEKISEQNASLQELCDILQSNGFEVEAMPDSDSFGAYVPSPEQGDLLKGIDNSLVGLTKFSESLRSKI